MQRVFYFIDRGATRTVVTIVTQSLRLNRKIKIIIEYDGFRYHGWQLQSNGITVQEVLQDCLYKITKQKTTVIASGRTDSGVHAEAQAAHFQTASRMTCHEFLMAFNSLLPYDIVVQSVEEVSPEFHAQTSATRKIYRYTVLNRKYPSALEYNRCLFVQTPLDIKAMRRAKAHLIGRHDFSALRASNCEAKNPVREIYKIDISKKGDFIYFHFDGNGFLKYMVRNIVGTLLEVGKKKIKPAAVKEILESKDRRRAGPTARAQGLCLVEVFYGGNEGSISQTE